MATTLWIARLYFFLPVAALTATLKNNLADALVNNGGLQIRAEELPMFTNIAIQASANGQAPASALGFNLPVKAAMRTAIRALIIAVPSSRYYIVANTVNEAQGWVEDQLLQTDSVTLAVGTAVTWAQCLADVLAATGLQIIPQAAP
jgi:hypothetical protein